MSLADPAILIVNKKFSKKKNSTHTFPIEPHPEIWQDVPSGISRVVSCIGSTLEWLAGTALSNCIEKDIVNFTKYV